MTEIAPVKDWATDFDVLDPRYVKDPFSIWDDLRGTCPIAHTNRRKSSWLPTRYEDVTAIAHDIEHFSSLKVAVIPGDEDEDPNAEFDGPNLEYGLPPISSDPPLHTWTRRLLLPWFSHKRVDGYVALTAGPVHEAAGRVRRLRACGRGGRLRAADPGPGHRPHPGRLARPASLADNISLSASASSITPPKKNSTSKKPKRGYWTKEKCCRKLEGSFEKRLILRAIKQLRKEHRLKKREGGYLVK